MWFRSYSCSFRVVDEKKTKIIRVCDFWFDFHDEHKHPWVDPL